ncbi:uncharacterized protein SCHCODRAFT_02504062 [Schizophyllum commune H4-8]|nr:uncharacterized protein SCHCODRAFT_02504062 [Schizophyllum commune H4-8]KAI5891917.1 hypothetical protein SCHCODRAFT_02504062 [Schizophyllum commune H4-8]
MSRIAATNRSDTALQTQVEIRDEQVAFLEERSRDLTLRSSRHGNGPIGATEELHPENAKANATTAETKMTFPPQYYDDRGEEVQHGELDLDQLATLLEDEIRKEGKHISALEEQLTEKVEQLDPISDSSALQPSHNVEDLRNALEAMQVSSASGTLKAAAPNTDPATGSDIMRQLSKPGVNTVKTDPEDDLATLYGTSTMAAPPAGSRGAPSMSTGSYKSLGIPWHGGPQRKTVLVDVESQAKVASIGKG